MSCVLLIDKPNESCQNSKKFERNAISTTKKKLLKRKGNSIAPAKTNAPISQTFSERLKLTIQTYQMRNKELTVCSCYVKYAFQSESILYSCLNVKELFARSRRKICNWTRTQNDLVLKRTLNYLAKCSLHF